MITIHQICYNEIQILEFAYNFYKSRFPNAKFVLHDNESTDGSAELAKKLGYDVRSFSTNNTFDDSTHHSIKNDCWGEDSTDWVLVADMDELIDIKESDLLLEAQSGTSIILTYGFQMVNLNKEVDLRTINSGFRDNDLYDKSLIFNKNDIVKMNWDMGAHRCHPQRPNYDDGKDVKFSESRYNLLHYKFLSENYIIKRYKEFKERLSNENIINGWGIHYYPEEEQLKQQFENIRNKELIKLL
jgi:hypothetical protein